MENEKVKGISKNVVKHMMQEEYINTLFEKKQLSHGM